MDRFGVDKPDLRFGMELVELTDVFAATEFKAFAGAAAIKGIRVPGAAGEYGRNQLDKLTDRAKSLGAKGLVWLKVAADGSFDSPVAKFLSADEAGRGRRPHGGAEPATSCSIVADEWTTTVEVLGQLRNDLGRPPVHEGPYRYVWVVDFPMFVGTDEQGRPKPAHHPFTMPHPDDLDRLETDPMAVRSQAYDLVLNGWELGSGSIRIHDTAIQRRVFAVLGITDEEADRKFGFFLNPFEYGAPPHGGFAFGIDRLVAILAGEENIREVIAFPKTQSGADPMTELAAARRRRAARPRSASASCPRAEPQVRPIRLVGRRCCRTGPRLHACTVTAVTPPTSLDRSPRRQLSTRRPRGTLPTRLAAPRQLSSDRTRAAVGSVRAARHDLAPDADCNAPDEYLPTIGPYTAAALIDANMGPDRSGDEPVVPALAAAIFLHATPTTVVGRRGRPAGACRWPSAICTPCCARSCRARPSSSSVEDPGQPRAHPAVRSAHRHPPTYTPVPTGTLEGSSTMSEHNLVVLRGVLAAEVTVRALPSGGSVSQFDVTTRDDAGTQTVPVAWSTRPLAAYRSPSGEEVVVVGTVRRRFFRVGGATQRRTEVVAERPSSPGPSRPTAWALADRRRAPPSWIRAVDRRRQRRGARSRCAAWG